MTLQGLSPYQLLWSASQDVESDDSGETLPTDYESKARCECFRQRRTTCRNACQPQLETEGSHRERDFRPPTSSRSRSSDSGGEIGTRVCSAGSRSFITPLKQGNRCECWTSTAGCFTLMYRNEKSIRAFLPAAEEPRGSGLQSQPILCMPRGRCLLANSHTCSAMPGHSVACSFPCHCYQHVSTVASFSRVQRAMQTTGSSPRRARQESDVAPLTPTELFSLDGGSLEPWRRFL